MHRCSPLLLSLWLTAGCASEPAWDRCAEPACYASLAAQRWDGDRLALLEDLGSLDAVAQEAVVLDLIKRRPEIMGELCDALPAGPAAERCKRLGGRPHLLGRGEPDQDRIPGVPGFTDHTGVGALPSPWSSVPADQASCDRAQDACWSRDVTQAAANGDPRSVAAVCNGVPDERFRKECFFRGAEASAVLRGRATAETMPTAAQLCLGAGRYAELCVRELARAIARGAPAADQDDVAGWEHAAAAVQALEAGLAERDPTVAARVADRAWAELLWGSYQRAEQVHGLPAASLPPAAAPHLRASLAWFLLEQEGPSAQGRGWEAWVERAALALASAEPTRAPSEGPRPPTRSVGSSIDPATHEGPWVHYLGDSYRRPLPDPSQDLQACLLEAAARQRAPQLLEQAAQRAAAPVAELAQELQRADIKAPRRPRPGQAD